MDSVRVIIFHLASTAAKDSVQKSSPYLSPGPRNLEGKLGSCTPMEAKIVRMAVSIRMPFRILILTSQSVPGHRLEAMYRVCREE